eukprot:4060946-Amphidinium_carterae.1
MYEYFHDENLISNALSLHEGVLFWMELDDIKDLEERAKGDSDPEATRDYARYLDENNHLDTKLRRDYKIEHGKLEDIEEYQQAILDKDPEGLKVIIYQYARTSERGNLFGKNSRSSRRTRGRTSTGENYYVSKQQRRKDRERKERENTENQQQHQRQYEQIADTHDVQREEQDTRSTDAYETTTDASRTA